MARFASESCWHVLDVGGLAEGQRTVVTRRATRRNPSVVHGCTWTPRDRARMAKFAGLSCDNVLGVGRLPLSQRPIVA
jgi:hypothetical protein